MSHAMMIQDWQTLSAPSSATIIQNEEAWKRCEGYQDACFYLEVANASAATTGNLYVQTSPTKDANFFDAFASGSTPGSIANFTLGSGALGVQTLKNLALGDGDGPAAFAVPALEDHLRRRWPLHPHVPALGDPEPGRLLTRSAAISNLEPWVKMGHSICLQPWTTISGTSNTIVQDEALWLDVGAAKDVAVYLEVSYANTSVHNLIQVQTSPTKDNAYFFGNPSPLSGVPWLAQFDSFGATLGLQPIQIVRFATSSITGPLCRFLRWSVTFASSNDEMTFRIWFNLNAGGR